MRNLFIKVKLAIISLVAMAFLSSPVLAQNEYNELHFGIRGYLNFQGPVVTHVGNGNAMSMAEASGSICNQFTGRLQFYTDGTNVWNRNHLPMPGGFGLLGHYSSAQSALVVYFPCDTVNYWIFTAGQQGYDASTPQSGIHYTKVDMTLQGGLGDVVAGQKNVLVQAVASERLTAIAHANGVDYWILVHSRGGTTWSAYRFSPAGVLSGPVVSNPGGYNQSNPVPIGVDWTLGQVKASPDGRHIINTDWFNCSVELLDFNASTGVVSNPIGLRNTGAGQLGNDRMYGAAFSPNSNLVYYSAGDTLYQVDITRPTPAQIIASTTLILPTSAWAGGVAGPMMIGKDGKIYMNTDWSQWGGTPMYIAVIQSPNIPGAGCNFTERGVAMPANWGSQTYAGVNMIDAKLTSGAAVAIVASPDTIACMGDTITLTASGGSSYTWSTGATTNSIKVTSGGTYSVASGGSCGASKSIGVVFVAKPTPVITGSIQACLGDTIQLSTSQVHSTYRWSTGASTRGITVKVPGVYTVTVTNSNGCTGTDSIAVVFTTIAKPIISGSNLCQGTTGTLTVGPVKYASYLWNTGSRADSITVGPGTYWVHVVDSNGCTSNDTITITSNPIQKPVIYGDSILCPGDSGYLYVAGQYASVRWSTGDSGSSIPVYGPGTYFVDVTTSAGCIGSDTIIVGTYASRNIGIVGNTTFCPGSSTLLNCVGTQAGDIVTWFDSTGLPIGSGIQILLSSGGTYYVSVITQTGCRIIDSTHIVILQNPSPIFLDTIVICPGGLAQFHIGGLTGTSIVGWEDGTIGPDATFDSTGNWWFHVIDTLTGCDYIDSVEVIVNPAPAFTINPGNAVICEGDSVMSWVGLGAAIAWYDISGNLVYRGDSIQLGPGTWIAEATFNGGCISTDTITITSVAVPSVSAGPDLIFCPGDTVNLAGTDTNATTVYWIAPDGTRIPGWTTQVTGSDTGTWIFAGENAIGCVDYDTVMVSTFSTNSYIFEITGGSWKPNEIGDVYVNVLTPISADTIEFTIYYDRDVVRVVGTPFVTIPGWNAQIILDTLGTLRVRLIRVSGSLIAPGTILDIPMEGYYSLRTFSLLTLESTMLPQESCVTTQSIPGRIDLGGGCFFNERLVILDSSGYSLRVIPNPVREGAVIQIGTGLSGPISIELIDGIGNVIDDIQMGENSPAGIYDMRLDVSEINAGLYYVRVRAGHVVLSSKILVWH